MKKLLGLLAAVGLAATSATSVVACTNTDDSGDESNKIDLGEIDNIFPETILNAYKAKVPSANISQLEVFDYTQTSARIIRTRAASTSTTFDPIEVKFTLKALDISENNMSLVRNILAGAMDENGVIDQSYSLQELNSKQAITLTSIRTSFAVMNGIYLNESDLELTNLTYAENSATVTLTSNNQDILKGDEPVILTINHGINSADLLRVTEIGTVHLPKDIYEIQGTYFDPTLEEGTTQTTAAYAILFQNLGDRNPLFQYLATDLIASSMAIVGEADENLEENLSPNFFRINLGWNGGPMASFMPNVLVRDGNITADSATTKATFELALDERPILGEHFEENLKVSTETYNSKDISRITREVYEQTNAEFRAEVPFELFERFSTINFSTEHTAATIEMLPGGDWVYGFDSRAFALIENTLDSDVADRLRPPTVGTVNGYELIIG